MSNAESRVATPDRYRPVGHVVGRRIGEPAQSTRHGNVAVGHVVAPGPLSVSRPLSADGYRPAGHVIGHRIGAPAPSPRHANVAVGHVVARSPLPRMAFAAR